MIYCNNMLQKTWAFILLQITLHNLHHIHNFIRIGFRKIVACILMVIFLVDFAKVVAEKEAETVSNAKFVTRFFFNKVCYKLDMILILFSPCVCKSLFHKFHKCSSALVYVCFLPGHD